MDTRDELPSLLDDLKRHLAWQQADGGRFLLRGVGEPVAAAASPVAAPKGFAPVALPPAAPASRPLAPATPQPAAPAPAAAKARAPAPAKAPVAAKSPGPLRSLRDLPKVPPLDGEGERKPLDPIRIELGDCKRCKLCDGRKNIVFGSGNPRAELVFVGEGPGADEDEQGVPFVGKAGQLLTKMIEAMGYSRDEVYICNVVKCRPPGNRNPELDEVQSCEPFLRAQLQAIRPKAIVALGKFAAQTLLRDETSISQLRGNWKEYGGIPLMPTFHPAYLLRDEKEKVKAWSDLKQVMKFFGKEAKK